tara:strand:- start:38159 stop:38413 length:255 start_codon:yes stop_codon:yes gene_type:complete
VINLKIELDGVKHSVRHLLETHNSEMSKMIQEEIERQITQDWVKHRIRQSVTDCINKSIDSLADNHRLREALKTVMIDQLLKDS